MSPHSAPVAGVDGFDRIGRADHSPDLDVVVQERNELAPRVVPAVWFEELWMIAARAGLGVGLSSGLEAVDVDVVRRLGKSAGGRVQAE